MAITKNNIRMLDANTPAVFANTLGSQTIPNTTWTTVNLGTEGLDAQNNFANNAFQVPSVGIYNIQAKVTVEASVHSALSQLYVKLQKGEIDVSCFIYIYSTFLKFYI